MKMYRQGDVLIQKIESLPGETQSVQARDGYFVLAEGEATGHAHRVLADRTQMFMFGALLYMKVLERAQVFHEEHGPIDLPEGLYKVSRQREYTPEAIRNVAD